jgi:DNA repair exonuclease SbcCD ATPase subunit
MPTNNSPNSDSLTFEKVLQLFQETSKELRELFKETDRQMKETDRQLKEHMKETDRRLKEHMQETDRQMKEHMQETDRQLKERMQETDRQIKETDRQLKEYIQETDRRMQETDRLLKERMQENSDLQKKNEKLIGRLSKQVGHLSQRFGELAEHLVAPGIIRLFNKLSYHFHEVSKLEIKDDYGKTLTEIDLLLENDETIVVVEVKAKPRENDIPHHVTRLNILREHIKNHKRPDKKIIGAIAGAIFDKQTKASAIEAGFYAITQSGDTLKMDVPPDFQPRIF